MLAIAINNQDSLQRYTLKINFPKSLNELYKIETSRREMSGPESRFLEQQVKAFVIVPCHFLLAFQLLKNKKMEWDDLKKLGKMAKGSFSRGIFS